MQIAKSDIENVICIGNINDIGHYVKIVLKKDCSMLNISKASFREMNLDKMNIVENMNSSDTSVIENLGTKTITRTDKWEFVAEFYGNSRISVKNISLSNVDIQYRNVFTIKDTRRLSPMQSWEWGIIGYGTIWAKAVNNGAIIEWSFA